MDEWKYDSARDLDLTTGQSLKSVRREVGLATTLASSLRWMMVRVYLRLCHRFEVQGRERLPNRLPLVLVANHTSHLDALTLASVMPARLNRQVFPIAAGDTFFETRPVAAFASLFMNLLPIWRRNCGAHSLEELRARLVEEPCGYIIFPEGTRSRTGKMTRFKPGIGRLVAGTSVPVLPCHLDGTHRALPPDRNWPRPLKVRLRVGEARNFQTMANERESWNQIASALEEAVTQLSGA